MLLLRIFVFFFVVLAGVHAYAEEEDPDAEKIVESFEADRCPDVVAHYRATQPKRYPAIVEAVVASCMPTPQESHALFEKALAQKPNDQAILLLYAQATWKTDRALSKKLWKRIRLVAREESYQRMAEDYLSGVVDISSEDRFSFGQAWSGWLYAKAQSGYWTNPEELPPSFGDPKLGSFGQEIAVDGRIKREKDWGDYSGHLAAVADSFYSRHGGDHLLFRMDPSATLNVGKSGAIVFSPYATVETLGGTPFRQAYGTGVMGIEYGKTYRQSVQTILYRDHYSDSTLQPQQGMHFRFEYDWLFYPSIFELSFGSFFEHTEASKDEDDTVGETITYSHNDAGIYGGVIARLNLLELGTTFFVSTRQDDNNSTYPGTSGLITKRRQDFSYEVRPTVAFPLERDIKLTFYYEYTKVKSNLGAYDYQDFNLLTRSTGLYVTYQMEWL